MAVKTERVIVPPRVGAENPPAVSDMDDVSADQGYPTPIRGGRSGRLAVARRQANMWGTGPLSRGRHRGGGGTY
ncbi:MAG: hypothetical protein WC686_00325 [Candidatus Shapirobacteria bacterium]|jgi:hypothetical protein